MERLALLPKASLKALTISEVDSTRERSTVVWAPVESVTTTLPRTIPAPPLRAEARVTESSRAAAGSKVKADAPIAVVLEVGKPAAKLLLGGDEAIDDERVRARGSARRGGGAEHVGVAGSRRRGFEGALEVEGGCRAAEAVEAGVDVEQSGLKGLDLGDAGLEAVFGLGLDADELVDDRSSIDAAEDADAAGDAAHIRTLSEEIAPSRWAGWESPLRTSASLAGDLKDKSRTNRELRGTMCRIMGHAWTGSSASR